MDWILFALLLATVAVIIALLSLTLPKIQCPHCQSRRAKFLDKTVVRTRSKRTMDMSAGGDVGMMIENIFRKRYRCQVCDTEWFVEEPD